MAEYRLQAEAHKAKGMYRIYKEDEPIKERTIRVYEDAGSKLKKRTLSVLMQGLLDIQGMLRSKDLLIVELNNQHLVKWLQEETEYKGYEIQSVLKTLNQMPCSYRIEQADLRAFKRQIEKSELQQDRRIGFAEILLQEQDAQ